METEFPQSGMFPRSGMHKGSTPSKNYPPFDFMAFPFSLTLYNDLKFPYLFVPISPII